MGTRQHIVLDIQQCGNTADGYLERRVPVSITVPHSRDEVTIVITTNLSSAPDDER